MEVAKKPVTKNEFIQVQQEYAHLFAGRRVVAFRVEGDCLAGRNIPHGSLLVFDLDTLPKFGSITICRYEGCSGVYAKVFYGPSLSNPGKFLVTTWHKDQKKDRSFLASQVRGVAIACFDANGSLLWHSSTKEELEAKKI